MIDTFYEWKLKDGRILEVIPLTYGRARIIIGDGFTVEDSW